MSSDPVKVFPFLFYLQITFETHRRAKRGTHRRAKRERERKKDSQTQWNGRERERERERERRESRESEQWPNPRRSGEIKPQP